MKLEKLSASALKSSETCMARFKAERDMPRDGRVEGVPQLLGSACHEALEKYVEQVHIRNESDPEWDILKLFFMAAYKNWFETADQSGPAFQDGLELLNKWYNRTVFGGFEILSVERFETYVIKTSQGPVNFNYIMDRLDKIGENKYRVVDYKTGRMYISPEQLSGDIQARIYALMVQIMYPDAEEIWVEFDYLRYAPSAVMFRKRDCEETWRTLRDAIKNIHEQDEDNPSETLNNECTFCVRNSTCSAVRANRDAGGVHTFGTIEELVNARAELAAQEKAARKARESLDDLILTHMVENEIFEINTPSVRASAKISFRRSIDADALVNAVGQEVFNKYAGKSMTLGRFEEMLASGSLDPETRLLAESCIQSLPSEPRLDTKFKTRFSQ